MKIDATQPPLSSSKSLPSCGNSVSLRIRRTSSRCCSTRYPTILSWKSARTGRMGADLMYLTSKKTARVTISGWWKRWNVLRSRTSGQAPTQSREISARLRDAHCDSYRINSSNRDRTWVNGAGMRIHCPERTAGAGLASIFALHLFEQEAAEAVLERRMGCRQIQREGRKHHREVPGRARSRAIQDRVPGADAIIHARVGVRLGPVPGGKRCPSSGCACGLQS